MSLQDDCRCTSINSAPVGCARDLFDACDKVYDGSIQVSGCNRLETLPDGLRVSGDLTLERVPNLSSLPRGFEVSGHLTIETVGLVSLGPAVTVSGNLTIKDCVALTGLLPDLHLGGKLTILNCPNLAVMPPGLQVPDDLSIEGCTVLTTLPDDLFVSGSLLMEESSIVALPKGLRVQGRVHFECSKHLVDFVHPISVRGDFYLSQTSITSLPAGLVLGAGLVLAGCEKLHSLPEHLHVPRTLNINRCTSLTSLPRGMRIGGSLEASSAGLVTLSDDLVVLGSRINFTLCEFLTSLPASWGNGGLHAARSANPTPEAPSQCWDVTWQDLWLYCCFNLTSLPPNLVISGTLQLYGCESLTELPPGLQVHRDMWAKGAGLTTLPADLKVRGDIELCQCEHLASIPEGICIYGSLDVSECRKLTSLPPNFSVGGYLNVSECRRLSELPPNMLVPGGLNAIRCTSLSRFSPGLWVGGSLCLDGCTSLTSLPHDIMTWPLNPRYDIRELSLHDTRLSDPVRQRLQTASTPITEVYFGGENDIPREGSMSDLKDALQYWSEEAMYDIEEALGLWSNQEYGSRINHEHKWELDDEQNRQLTSFLVRLRATVEYGNPHLRASLVDRVCLVFGAMQKHKSLTQLCGERVALDSGTDGDFELLKQLERAVQVYLARQDENSKAALEALGIALMKLEIVHQHAAASFRRLVFADEAEVVLLFEVVLREDLHLPVATTEMLCGIQVTDEEIDAAKHAANEAAADPQRRAAFFATWEPWQQSGFSELPDSRSSVQ